MVARLKVCGMRDSGNIHEVASAGPDYLGFIFYEPSPRFVGADFTMPALPAHILKVGVFVNSTTQEMLDKSRRYGLDYLQLHGSEPPSQVEELRSQGIKVIKVFSLGDGFDFGSTVPYKASSEYFLFDTKGKYFGGNAKTFDWNVLKKYDQEIPFFLSGGIGLSNVHGLALVSEMNIHAIDVNSGVEVSPGIKDVEKIIDLKRFLNSKMI